MPGKKKLCVIEKSGFLIKKTMDIKLLKENWRNLPSDYILSNFIYLMSSSVPAIQSHALNGYWRTYHRASRLIILGKCFCDLWLVNWSKCPFSGRRALQAFFEGILGNFSSCQFEIAGISSKWLEHLQPTKLWGEIGPHQRTIMLC